MEKKEKEERMEEKIEKQLRKSVSQSHEATVRVKSRNQTSTYSFFVGLVNEYRKKY